MKKRNYKLPEPYWKVTERTKRAEATYKGWDHQRPMPVTQKPFKSRWVSRLEEYQKSQQSEE
jgi:hypothetical protein